MNAIFNVVNMQINALKGPSRVCVEFDHRLEEAKLCLFILLLFIPLRGEGSIESLEGRSG